MTQYLAMLIERQEMAFIRWKASGYSDFAAHDEYLRWRDKAMAQKVKEESKL